VDLARIAIEKRLISALATLLILFGGLYAYQNLPRFEDPEFVIRQAQVITSYPGASAGQVAEEVTEVVENAIQQLSGIKELRSVSSIGRSEVTVEFTIPAARTREALDALFTKLRNKISDVSRSLPPGAGPPVVVDDYGDVFAQYYAITGDGFTLKELNDYAKDLQRELVLVPGVSKVVIDGVPREVVFVEYDAARLTRLGLSPDSIAGVLEGQNLVTPAGSVVVGDRRFTIRADAAVATLDSIGNLVIADGEGRSYRLRDIATVTRGIREPVSKLYYRNGEPAITLGVANQIGGNVVEMGRAVDARMDALIAQRPLGIDVVPISDQGASVDVSVKGFVMNVGLAVVIVVGVLLVFLGLRSSVLMGWILLVTVAGTLIGMYLYGLDMQRISLGALIIALGMLVDNAIVVVDGTLVRVSRGEPPGEAAARVVDQTKWPLLGGTVVGLLAFSPIGFSPDNTGEFAGSLFWTITIALLVSWLVAVWLTPYYCSIALRAPVSPLLDETRPAGSPEHPILRGYRAFLARAIRWRYGTIALVAALFASSIVVAPLVPPGFFPPSTRDQFVIDYFLPEGTDIERTASDLREIADWVRGQEGVTGTNTVVGAGHQRFMLIYSSESPNSAYGQILVDVDAYSSIAPLLTRIGDRIAETYPDSSAKVWMFMLGPGGGAKIEARFIGPDATVLRSLADEARAIFTEAGAIGVKDDWRGMVQVIRPRVDEAKARRLGLTQADISRAIEERFVGTSIGVFREGDELLSIVMRPGEADRASVEAIRDVQVFSPALRRYVPITQAVDGFETVFENSRLRRIDRALAITAQADPAPGVLSGDLFEEVRPLVEAIPLPPGYSLVWKGEYGSSQDANAGLASTMPIGFGAMVLVVFFLFNAVRQPLIIWLTVPLAAIGVIWGLVLFDTPLEFMAILGALSLTGMLIKNAIILIDEADFQIRSGLPRMTAVTEAAVSRVRPVALGVITTVLGVVPLLWDPFFRSLAIVIICGLTFATVLTLVIVPVLYATFFRIREGETGQPEPAGNPAAVAAEPAH